MLAISPPSFIILERQSFRCGEKSRLKDSSQEDRLGISTQRTLLVDGAVALPIP